MWLGARPGAAAAGRPRGGARAGRGRAAPLRNTKGLHFPPGVFRPKWHLCGPPPSSLVLGTGRTLTSGPCTCCAPAGCAPDTCVTFFLIFFFPPGEPEGRLHSGRDLRILFPAGLLTAPGAQAVRRHAFSKCSGRSWVLPSVLQCDPWDTAVRGLRGVASVLRAKGS